MNTNDPSRRGRSSKAKGSTGEREVANILQEWWGQIEPGTLFTKTPQSGGWGTAQMREGFKMAGDICTTAARWPFTVEVKRREAWSIGTFAKGKRSPVWEWWRQCIEEAAEEHRDPMLWVRKNRQPWLVLVEERILIPVLYRARAKPDVAFTRLAPTVDDGGLRPAAVFGDTLISLHPRLWVPTRRRKAA